MLTTCTCMCIAHEFHSAVETTTVILADNVVELELLKATFFAGVLVLKCDTSWTGVSWSSYSFDNFFYKT